eukprot:gene42407-52588_t
MFAIGLPHGHGTKVFENGDEYNGGILEGQMTGKGQMIYAEEQEEYF